MGISRLNALTRAAERLEAGGIEDARRNAEWMLCDTVGSNRAGLYAHPEEPLTAEQERELEDMVQRRLTREPLQYVLGHTDFFDLRLKVTPDVLIPRPETEEVVEEALRIIGLYAKPNPSVLDIGTGSGCIALTVKHWRPATEVYATDISEAALAVAEENAVEYSLKVHFVRADVRSDDFADAFSEPFDVIISNPPYIPDWEMRGLQDEVRHFEPAVALFAGEDPFTYYRAITKQAKRLLHPGGWLVLETHADYGRDTLSLFRQAGFEELRIERDLAGKDRIAIARKPPGDEPTAQAKHEIS